MQRLNLSLTRLRFPRAAALPVSRTTVLFHPAPAVASVAPARLFADAKLNMALLKRLRDMTGAPLHTCKEAVTAACADASLGSEQQQLDAAVEFLRKKGVSSAAKKASRATSQGLLGLVTTADNRSATLIEVNCETDFVARNVTFQNFAAGVAVASLSKAAAGNIATEDLTSSKLVLPDGSAKEAVKDAMQQVIFSTGENVNVRRGTGLSVPAGKHGVVAAYMHNVAPGHGFEGKAQLGRTAALVQLHTEQASIPTQELLDLGNKIAMHIVAINPLYLSKESVPADVLAKEKDIYLTEANNKAAGKPAHVLEKMIQGKLSKYFDETCLLEQQFVVNAEGEKPKKVRDVLKVKADNGSAVPVSLVAFARYSVGEGAESQ